MRRLLYISLAGIALAIPAEANTLDTTKLLWDRDFVVECGYGHSFVSMHKLN